MPELRQFLDSLTNEQLLDRLNLALDGASLGIWDWDLRDDAVQFDRRWCEMLGLDVEKLPMKLSTWEQRVHPDDLGQCYADIQAYLNGRTPYYQNIHRMQHADGEWIYILDRGRISGWDEQGKPIRFTGTHFDCTATEKAKRVLQHQQELLVDMIRNLPTAVAMFDAQGRYLTASDEWLGFFELHEAELAGHTHAQLGELGRCGVEFPAEWESLRRRAFEGELLSAEQDPILVAGRHRYLRWSMRPWWTGSDVAGVIIAFDDVTQITEDRVARERESRLSTLGLMAGGIAHEINTPLQTLMVNATMIEDELARSEFDGEFLRECNDAIIATTQHIARTIHALRTVSRQSASDPLSAIDMVAIAGYMLDLCGARFRAEGIDFRVTHTGERHELLGRPADIGQILLNLLNNAFDAVVGTPQPWVELATSSDEQHVVFRVTDSGPGIPARILDRLMTPFCTTKPLGKGTGLGLSLSKSLAEGQGAELVHVAHATHTSFELRFARGAS
ncbi:PAS domain-containing protein [Nannocystaceae bacterium ST9]